MQKFGIFVLLLVLMEAQNSSSQASSCDSGAPDVDPNNCCGFPDFFPDEVAQECAKSNGIIQDNETDPSFDWTDDLCIVECVFNQSGLSNDNDLDREAIANYFASESVDDPWLSMINQTLEECLNSMTDENLTKFVKDIIDYSAKKQKAVSLCPPKAGYLLDCIYFSLFVTCPETKFTEDENCTSLKDFAIKCDDW